jgi:murein DD-endopeptidase MepM/ murein hydrolase activator NlpD
MDWPTQEGRMSRNFGWNDHGKPVRGVCFEVEGPIRAADAGEILFYNDPAGTASRIPSPLGAWIAIDHGDGLVSIYSRVDEAQLPETLSLVEKDTVIAASGKSGRSGNEGFYFSVFDRRERRWVNPSMIITPLPDTKLPSILSVTLRNGDNRTFNPAQTRNISQGRYTVSVEVSDTREDNGDLPLAPFRITCYLNGVEQGYLNFETFSVRDGIAMAYRNSLVPVRQVYAPYPGFEIGDVAFTRGQVTLEIIALDSAQNPRNVVYRLQVD